MRILRYNGAPIEQEEVILRAKRYEIIRVFFLLVVLPVVVGLVGVNLPWNLVRKIACLGFVVGVMALLGFARCVVVYLWESLQFKLGRRLTGVGTFTDLVHDFMCTR